MLDEIASIIITVLFALIVILGMLLAFQSIGNLDVVNGHPIVIKNKVYKCKQIPWEKTDDGN